MSGIRPLFALPPKAAPSTLVAPDTVTLDANELAMRAEEHAKKKAKLEEKLEQVSDAYSKLSILI